MDSRQDLFYGSLILESLCLSHESKYQIADSLLTEGLNSACNPLSVSAIFSHPQRSLSSMLEDDHTRDF